MINAPSNNLTQFIAELQKIPFSDLDTKTIDALVFEFTKSDLDALVVNGMVLGYIGGYRKAVRDMAGGGNV